MVARLPGAPYLQARETNFLNKKSEQVPNFSQCDSSSPLINSLWALEKMTRAANF